MIWIKMAKFEREKDSVNALIDECSSFVQNHSNLSFNSLDKNTRAFQTRLDAAARHIEECKTDNIVHFESWEPVKPIFGQIGTLNYKKKRLDQIISREKDLQSKIYSFQRFYPVNEEIRLIWSGRLLRLNNGKYYNVFNRNDNHVCINVYDKDLKTLGKSKTLLSPFQHAGMSISSYGFKNRIYICWADRRMNDALALLIAVDEELNIVSRNDSLSGISIFIVYFLALRNYVFKRRVRWDDTCERSLCSHPAQTTKNSTARQSTYFATLPIYFTTLAERPVR